MKRYWLKFIRAVFETTIFLERRDKARQLRAWRAARDETSDPLWRAFNHRLGHNYWRIVSVRRHA